jgi:DNA invertase Pin-like site-specific DNA recombinase
MVGRVTPNSAAIWETVTSPPAVSGCARWPMHMFGALAEFERALMAGLAAARLRGRRGGRPRALSAAQRAHAAELAAAGIPIREIAELLGAGRSTVYRTLCRYL